MADEGALISCKCGSVQVLTSSSKPRVRAYCCCPGCCYAEFWAFNETKPVFPAYAEMIYYDNSFKILKGEEKLVSYYLHHGYTTQRIFSTCCNSNMFCNHPAYQGNTICTSIKRVSKNLVEIPIDIVFFAKFWPKQIRDQLPKANVIFASDEPNAGELFGPILQKWGAPVATHKDGYMTMEEFLSTTKTEVMKNVGIPFDPSCAS